MRSIVALLLALSLLRVADASAQPPSPRDPLEVTVRAPFHGWADARGLAIVERNRENPPRALFADVPPHARPALDRYLASEDAIAREGARGSFDPATWRGLTAQRIAAEDGLRTVLEAEGAPESTSGWWLRGELAWSRARRAVDAAIDACDPARADCTPGPPDPTEALAAWARVRSGPLRAFARFDEGMARDVAGLPGADDAWNDVLAAEDAPPTLRALAASRLSDLAATPDELVVLRRRSLALAPSRWEYRYLLVVGLFLANQPLELLHEIDPLFATADPSIASNLEALAAWALAALAPAPTAVLPASWPVDRRVRVLTNAAESVAPTWAGLFLDEAERLGVSDELRANITLFRHRVASIDRGVWATSVLRVCAERTRWLEDAPAELEVELRTDATGRTKARIRRAIGPVGRVPSCLEAGPLPPGPPRTRPSRVVVHLVRNGG